MPEVREADVAVVGGGPAGLVAACLVARLGLKVCLIARDRASEAADPRTIALMQPSIRLLEHLSLAVQSSAFGASPLWRLKLIDDTGRWLAHPPATFDAREAGDQPFGWNVPIAPLVAALEARAQSLGAHILRAEARGLEGAGRRARIETTGEPVLASLVLAADGIASRMRGQVGIDAAEWDYGQSAIAASFAHTAPHNGASFEYHKPDGPLTTVPLQGGRSSLVWMLDPERARSLMEATPADFARTLQAELHGLLGRVSDVGPRRLFPMRGLLATTFAANRTLLMGEAAHVIPPLGAQGLNMSFRDAATAAELIGEALSRGEDIGGPGVLEEYDRRRRRDVLPRQGIIHAVNASLLSDWALPNAARTLGIVTGARVPALRTMIVRHGLGQGNDLPASMREQHQAQPPATREAGGTERAARRDA